MNKEIIVQELHNWMQNFVEKPNPMLAGWAPCPFARQARINNLVEIVFADSLLDSLHSSLDLLDHKDVVVICFDHKKITAESLEQLVSDQNKIIMEKDYVILEDHPDKQELVNGVQMNFSKCGLLLLQKLSKLNQASEQLRAKNYYEHWPKEVLDYVLNWRIK